MKQNHARSISVNSVRTVIVAIAQLKKHTQKMFMTTRMLVVRIFISRLGPGSNGLRRHIVQGVLYCSGLFWMVVPGIMAWNFVISLPLIPRMF